MGWHTATKLMLFLEIEQHIECIDIFKARRLHKSLSHIALREARYQAVKQIVVHVPFFP